MKPSRSQGSWARWPHLEAPTSSPASAAASSMYVSHQRVQMCAEHRHSSLYSQTPAQHFCPDTFTKMRLCTNPRWKHQSRDRRTKALVKYYSLCLNSTTVSVIAFWYATVAARLQFPLPPQEANWHEAPRCSRFPVVSLLPLSVLHTGRTIAAALTNRDASNVFQSSAGRRSALSCRLGGGAISECYCHSMMSPPFG